MRLGIVTYNIAFRLGHSQVDQLLKQELSYLIFAPNVLCKGQQVFAMG